MTDLYVFVDGTFSSGKTAFIHSLSEIDIISTELAIPEENDTLACDFGMMTIDENAKLLLFGAPASRRLDVTHSCFDNLMGVIFVVDSPHPYSLRQAKLKLHQWWFSRDLPIIVVANKQDKPDACHPDMIRVKLNIPSEIPVVPCIASTGQGVTEAMIALCRQYLAPSVYDR